MLKDSTVQKMRKEFENSLKNFFLLKMNILYFNNFKNINNYKILIVFLHFKILLKVNEFIF